MGILAGDLLDAYAHEVLANSKFLPVAKVEALNQLSLVLKDVIIGEGMDVHYPLQQEVSEKDVFNVLGLKTARYTVDGPLKIGAILAGADKKILDVLNKYSMALGVAYQIQDDLLGIFGKQEKTGKSVDSDIKEGKKTLLVIEAQKRANAKQKKILAQALGNEKLTQKQAEEFRKVVIETGALEYSQKMAEKLMNEAKKTLEKATLPKEPKQFLLDIADYIISREK